MPSSMSHGVPSPALPEANYVIITPYLLPAGSLKKVNIGDGFILDSAIKLIGAKPRALISSRVPLSEADIAQINESRCVIAAGANTLKDDFELTPGFDLATLARLRVPVILMGVGHYGVAEVTRGLKPASRALFQAMLDRFPLMSVRCDASRQYVLQALPDEADNILMTSCPVVHRVDDVHFGFVRKELYEQLVVTITDRAMLQTQLGLLPAAKSLFPAKRRILALHQNYNNTMLGRFAAGQGFEVFHDPSYEPFLSLYGITDVHFGNRVHAHLKCLSLGVTSYLTPFELRQVYFAESLDFPLVSQALPHELANYDFTRIIARRDAARRTMDDFVVALRKLL
jgi:Polysaccharide pyruvyl transferase